MWKEEGVMGKEEKGTRMEGEKRREKRSGVKGGKEGGVRNQ